MPFQCAQPLLTAGLAAAVLGQMLSGRDILAMTVILAGVALVIKAKLADDKRRWVLPWRVQVSASSEFRVMP